MHTLQEAKDAIGELSRVDTAASVWLPNRSANFQYYKVKGRAWDCAASPSCMCSFAIALHKQKPQSCMIDIQGCNN